MLENVIVAAVIGGLPIGLFFLRTQAALVIMTLFAGTWLSNAVYDDALVLVGGVVKINQSVEDGVSAALVLLPALLIALHYRKSSASKLLLQLAPMLVSGIVALFLLLNVISDGNRKLFESTQVYGYIRPYQDLVIAGAVLVSMLVVIAIYKRPKPDEHHGKKHHK